MTTPAPAVLDITISRREGFLQDLTLRAATLASGGGLAAGAALRLRGRAFYAQLWDADRSRQLASLRVPVVSESQGQLQLLLTELDVLGAITNEIALSGGSADSVGPLPAYSGGIADDTGIGDVISGGAAEFILLPDTSRWDLLLVSSPGKRRYLLRGVATAID